MKIRTIWMLLIVFLLPTLADKADGQLVRKGGSFLMRKLGREAGEETAERAGKQAVSKAARAAAVSGATSAARKAGNHGVKQASRGLAAKFASQYGDDAAVAVGKVSSQSARRLAMLGPGIKASGHGKKLMTFLAKTGDGDRIIDFLYRNKGTLAGGTVLAAVIANPNKVLGATSDTVSKVLTATGKSMVEPIAAEAGRPLGRWLGFTVFVVCTLGAGTWMSRYWIRSTWFGPI